MTPTKYKDSDPMCILYRTLSEDEKETIGSLKLRFEAVWQVLDSMGHSRELSMAKTHLEDACMRAVRHVTKGDANG